MHNLARIICADWGKEEKKRAVYEAIVADRLVRRVASDVRTVSALLGYAAGLGAGILVAFDAPLGVPESFIEAVRKTSTVPRIDGFVDWLLAASLDHCKKAHDWSLSAPFFQVPAGDGALGRFEAAAKRYGVELRRRIEKQTGGKSVFITAGLPGSVGSAARDIWQGLVAARKQGTPFSLWPFEGTLDELLLGGAPVVAEIYPRAAYSTALVDHEPRARMSLAKTDADTRRRAVHRLLSVRWVGATGVRFENLDEARANEDDFDALMTAAALLRCQLEGLPLWAAPLHAPSMEGGILTTGSVDLTLPEKAFAW
jgi:hypothetical protein